MDILWGAWAREVKQNEHGSASGIDIMGIYTDIYKRHKADFPFKTDLLVVLACEANKAEFEKPFLLTLEMIDQDGRNRIFSKSEILMVSEGDIPLRWYESHRFKNVEVREDGYYELSVLVDGQYKQRVPLWVTTPKSLVWEQGKEDIVTEMHVDDFEEWQKGH